MWRKVTCDQVENVGSRPSSVDTASSQLQYIQAKTQPQKNGQADSIAINTNLETTSSPQYQHLLPSRFWEREPPSGKPAEFYNLLGSNMLQTVSASCHMQRRLLPRSLVAATHHLGDVPGCASMLEQERSSLVVSCGAMGSMRIWTLENRR